MGVWLVWGPSPKHALHVALSWRRETSGGAGRSQRYGAIPECSIGHWRAAGWSIAAAVPTEQKPEHDVCQPVPTRPGGRFSLAPALWKRA